MESIWTDDLVKQLEALWIQGLSSAEIGRNLGISKNAVVGKAHRLMLVSRPSPIKNYSPRRLPPSRATGGHCRFITAKDYLAALRAGKTLDDITCKNRAKPDSVYCTDHHAICFLPAGYAGRGRPREDLEAA